MTDMTSSQAGLSIFDDPDEEATGAVPTPVESDAEVTQALPAVTDRTTSPITPQTRGRGGFGRVTSAKPRADQAAAPSGPTPAVAPQTPPADTPAMPDGSSGLGVPTVPVQAAAPPPAAAHLGSRAPSLDAPLPQTTTNRAASQPLRPEFPVVRRGGYDRAAVDAFVAAYDGDADERIASLQAQVEALQQRLAENDTPTYSGLGGHAASILRLAEEQAATVTASANRAADETRRLASRDAAALRSDAEKEAVDIRTAHLREIEERRASVLADAEQERTLSRAEATDILSAAERAAGQLKVAAQQEANSLRTAARREGEQARAVSDRETMEARRQLAVDRERLTREATDRHGAATEETNRLVAEAESRASAAEERAREAMGKATKHRQQAAAEADRSLSRARLEAEQIVSAARKQADQIISNATANAERQTAVLGVELQTLQQRRDGIVAQLAQLRDLAATFGADEATSRPTAPSPDSK